MTYKEPKGFSIIELLVVIAVITLLAIIGIVALNSSREKARDAKRIADIRQIQTALELYYSDEDEYPIVEQAITLGVNDGAKLCDKASGGFVTTDTQCQIEYMREVPNDPLPGQANLYLSDGEEYTIQFETEQETSLGSPGTYRAHSESYSRP